MFLLITSLNFRPFRDSEDSPYCDVSHTREGSFSSVQGMWRQQAWGRRCAEPERGEERPGSAKSPPGVYME